MKLSLQQSLFDTFLHIYINLDKSILSHTQTTNFIGARVDSVSAQVFLPADRFCVMCSLVTCITCKPRTSVCCCLSLLGHMAACTYVTPFARLRLRCLQAWFHLTYQLTGDCIDSKVTVLSGFLASLASWSNPTKLMVGNPLQPYHEGHHCDRHTGWGAQLDRHTTQDT